MGISVSLQRYVEMQLDIRAVLANRPEETAKSQGYYLQCHLFSFFATEKHCRTHVSRQCHTFILCEAFFTKIGITND